MAIATDIEVNWNGTVDITNKIGLSKPFTELASDVWADDSAFITAYNNPAAKFTKVSEGYPTCPVKSNDCPWYLTGGIGYSNINHNSDSIYLRSAIICIPDDFVYNTWNGNQGGRIRNNINNFRIVTSMSTEKNGVETSLTVQDGTVVGAQYLLKETLTGTSSNGGITIGAGTYILMIVDIYTVEGNYYLNIPYSLPGFVYDTNNGDGVMGMWAYDSSVNKMFSLSPQIFPTDDGRISIVGGAVYNVNTWNRHELPAVDGDENLIFCASYIPWNWYLSLSGNVHYHLLAVSRYGLKFKYNGDTYKPIIAQGVVTGYTTDMTVPSDIDNWTDISGHNISPVPPVPPTPGDDEDNDDPVSTVGAPFGTGLAHYYVSTVDSTVLSQISEAMSTWDIDTSKKDLYRNLISCKIIKPPAGIPASPSTFEIYGVKPQYQGTDITINEVTGNPSITFGSYDIPRKFNDFRDYAPYSKAEIFIPYCGWCALPSHVIGRSVSVQYFTDVIAGTVKAVVYCGFNVVAEAAGVMAVDVPFAAENVGAKVAAATTGLLSYGQGALQASAGIGQAVVSKGKQGTKNIANGLATVIGAYNQLAMTANENWTEINGKSGDGCCLAGISTIIIKITRPKYGNFTAPYYVPEDFPHTVGFIAMKKTTPAACTGLIICDNVDTSGISGATERERQLIKEYLESGIIVEHPE